MVIFIHGMVYETGDCCLGKPGGVTLAWLRSSPRACHFSKGAGSPNPKMNQ